jgi:hypothetical protein
MYRTRAKCVGRSFVVLGVLVWGLAFQQVLAQTDEPTDSGTEAEVAVGGANWDANKRVLDDITEWKRTNPMARSLQQRDDVLVVEGTAFVALNADDKRWPKARSLGYQQAFMDAMGKYVSLIRSRVTSRLIREQFEEDLDESELTFDPEDSVSSQLERISEKVAILGERKLDQALSNSGMNEEEIARLTPAQKKTTFSDRMTRRTTIEAFGSAAGLVPIKTFEAIDNEGNTAIGVVAASSRRMRGLSTRIARGKSIAPDADRARRSIAEQLAEMHDDELVDQFGVRVYWDEQGYPVIVAFGQWGFSNEGLNKRKIARRRDFAGAQAENDARAHLVTFIRAATRFTEESTVGADVEEAFNVMPDNTVEEGEVETARLADVLVKKASVTSQAELTGMATSRTWSARHPDLESQEIVGAVVTWSPAAEKAVRAAVRDDEPPEPPAQQERPAPRGTSTRQSREDMDSSDF